MCQKQRNEHIFVDKTAEKWEESKKYLCLYVSGN